MRPGSSCNPPQPRETAPRRENAERPARTSERYVLTGRPAFSRALSAPAGDDVDLDGGDDVGVQTHRGAVAPGRLDRWNDLDLTAVDGGAAGVLDGLGQVRGGDGAEKAAVRTGGGDDGDDILDQPGASLLGLLQGLLRDRKSVV